MERYVRRQFETRSCCANHFFRALVATQASFICGSAEIFETPLT